MTNLHVGKGSQGWVLPGPEGECTGDNRPGVQDRSAFYIVKAYQFVDQKAMVFSNCYFGIQQVFQAFAGVTVLGPDVRATGHRTTVPRLGVTLSPGLFDDTQLKSPTQQLLFGASRDLHRRDAKARQRRAITGRL